MKIIILIPLIFFSGCSYIGVAWDKGAKANDAALNASEAVICKGASIGAIQRKYGNNAAKAQAWRTLCLDSGSDIVR